MPFDFIRSDIFFELMMFVSMYLVTGILWLILKHK